MKKFFSLIALVGVIAACTPEQIETAFKLAGADGTITVTVKNIDGSNFTESFSITGYESLPNSSISYSGNQAVITFAAEESQAIAQTNLTLTASGASIVKAASAPVSVPGILAGGHAELACQIMVGENAGNYYIDDVYTAGDDVLSYYFLENTHYATHAYSHSISSDYGDVAIDSWYINNSDLMLTGTVNIAYKEGYTAGVSVDNKVAGFETNTASWIEAMAEEDIFELDYPYEFSVSAWAMWNVVMVSAETPVHAVLYAYPYNADGTINEDGAVELASSDYSIYGTAFGMIELPYPGMPGHAHYEQGHGHGHGADNAGGGMAINE